MPRLQKDPGFLTHIQGLDPNKPYVISAELKGYVGRGVDEFVFLPNTVDPKNYECKQEEVDQSPAPPRKPAEQEQQAQVPEKPDQTSFLRIINTKTFFPNTDATLTITPAEYKAAQRLGLTKNIDQALTAKLIGALGGFRYESRRDAVLYGIYDDMYLEEEAICQTFFERAEALQALERAHGGSKQELQKGLEEYIEWLENKIGQSGLGKEMNPGTHQELLYSSYQRDLAHARKLLNKLENTPPPALRATSPRKGGRDTGDVLKNQLEEFLHERLNENLRHARETDELITVGSRINPFRGRLTTALVSADQMLTEHRFDQDRRAQKTHQGDYSDKRNENLADGQVERITLTSFHAQLGSQKASMERFTLTAALILGEPAPEDPMTYKPNRATWSSPGWARIIIISKQSLQKMGSRARKFWNETVIRKKPQKTPLPENPNIQQKYEAYISKAEGAKLNFISVGLQDLGNLIYDSIKALGVSFASIFSSFFEAMLKLGMDFNDHSRYEHPKPRTEAETLEELKENMEWNSMSSRQQVQSVFYKIFQRLEEDRVSVHSDPGLQDAAHPGSREKAINRQVSHSLRSSPPHTPSKENPDEAKQLSPEEIQAKQERIRAKINQFVEDWKNGNIEQAPLALPPHALVAYNPDDLLSAAGGGLETFYQFFAKMHDENPSICIYAMSIYVLAIASMAAPALVAATSSKIGIPMDWFVKFNQLSGVAMAKGEMAQITSAAFTDWQIMTTALEALAGGQDSLLGAGASFAKSHFVQTVGAVMSVYGVGALLTSLIPIFREELGTTPQILQFFTGLKVVVGGYEAFESAPHERSIVGSFLFDTMDFIILATLRCPLSIVNAIYMALRAVGVGLGKAIGVIDRNYETRPFNWINVLRPWAELLHKTFSGAMRIVDFLLRALNVLGRIVKMLVKALTDFVFGWLVFVSKTLPIVMMLAAFIVTPLLWPFAYKFLRTEIIPTLKGLKKDTHEFLSNPKSLFKRRIIAEQSPTPALLDKKPEKSLGERIAIKIWHGEATPLPALLLRLKFGIYTFFDHNITRPIKNLYKAGRNNSARYLNRRQSHLDRRILGWVASKMAVRGRGDVSLGSASLDRAQAKALREQLLPHQLDPTADVRRTTTLDKLGQTDPHNSGFSEKRGQRSSL